MDHPEDDDDHRHSTDKQRLKKALDAMIFLPHLKDRQAKSVLSALLPDEKGPHTTGRPWDKGDLFRRLKTFKASTWFAKPDPISAEECARRGWQNTDVDIITCESCKAVVSCPIAMQLLPDEAHKAAEQYAKKIGEAHAVACPWRSAACSATLLRFPQLPKSAVGLDFEERATTMQTLICLPPLAPTAVNTLLGSRGPLGPIVSQFIECGPSSSSSDATATTATPPLPPLKKSTTGTATATTTAENALITSLSRGVATCDQDAFLRRLRMITLCGWSVETLVSGNTSTDAPSSSSSSLSSCSVNPESAMLCCALCGAKAGLWSNFPGCEPQAGAQTASKTAPALPKLQPPPSFQTAGKDMSMSSPNTCGGGGTVLNRNVAINLATTIAGGRMEEGDKNGPLGGGGGIAAAGPFSSSSPAFGLPPPLPRTTNDSNNNTSEVPVFGFDALRAAEQQGASGSLHHRHLSSSSAQAAARHSAAAKRRRDDDTFIQNALGLTPPPLPPPTTTATTVGEKSGIEKRSRTENGAAPSMNKLASVPFSGGGGGGASSSATKPTQATLQKYRSMQSTPLDPLLLHRHHCPWVHALSSGSTTTTTTIYDGDNDGCTATGSDSLLPDVMCGWQWCALQLGPGVETIPKSKSGGGGGAAAAGMDDDDYGGDGGTGGAVWDPAAVLRSALAKVEVHPSSKKSVNPKK